MRKRSLLVVIEEQLRLTFKPGLIHIISIGHLYDKCCCLTRIRSENDGWCPWKKISSLTYEYLEIDFVNLTVITLIELQGKFSLMPVRLDDDRIIR
jgi:hypothetical protein